jgi:hypothetical protein
MKFALLAAALLALQSGAALACSIPEDKRPLEVQRDEFARWSWARAKALLEVEAVASSRGNRPGAVRVLRVLEGPIRPGRLLALRSVDPSLCGAGDFKRGSRGLIFLDGLSGRPAFHGWLPADYLQRLDRLGLRPIGSTKLRR